MSLCMSLSQRSVCDCNKRILYCTNTLISYYGRGAAALFAAHIFYLRQGDYVTPSVYLSISLLLCQQDFTKKLQADLAEMFRDG